jgi:hypothetical protein
MLRMRAVGRALVRSEEHLEAISRFEANLERLATTAENGERHLSFLAATEAREILQIMSDPRFDDPLRLERSGFKVHSQYDEDGIIAEIFRRIGTTNRICVEFGAGNGSENCTGFLVMQGWRALWIDGSDSFLFYMNVSWAQEMARDQLVVRNAFITVDTIDELIRDAGFSGEIDLLVVDLDGNDYHILEKISAVSPRAICVEYNSNIPPDVDWKMPRKDDHVWDHLDDRVGASLKALEIMLGQRGYALVGCSVAGVNAFFVRRDLAEGKFAEPFTAENHFHTWRFFYKSPHFVTNWREWPTRR